jgi:hypothetical protein
MDVDPIALAGGEGCRGDHIEFSIADRFGDRVGRGVNGDLNLLIPKHRLLLLDLAVQAVGLTEKFQLLLPKFKRDCRDRAGTEEAEEEFDHGRRLLVRGCWLLVQRAD